MANLTPTYQHVCDAAGCSNYRRTTLSSRVIEWCAVSNEPMQPCMHIVVPADRHDADGRPRANQASKSKRA